MKVLHVYKDYPPVFGGIENHVRLLAEGQARAGVEVTVLVTTGGRSSDRIENGVRVIRSRRWLALASTPIGPGVPAGMLRLDSDLHHIHMPYPPAEVAELLCRPKACIATYHSDIVRQRILGRIHRPMQARLLARVDRILVDSPPYLASSSMLAPVASKCTVVPLGIDPAPFLSRDDGRVAALRGRTDGPLVLFVGRLRYYKGVATLIRAIEDVDATLLIVGRGPMERRWRRLASASPASGRIRFLGSLDEGELAAHYQAADVAVLPSHLRSEAFGLVLVEAMTAGTPVISTELGTGTSFVNRHGETGFVVPPGDPLALAAALRELLANPELRRRFGDAARRRALECFQADRMIRETVEIYRDVLRRRHPRAAR